MGQTIEYHHVGAIIEQPATTSACTQDDNVTRDLPMVPRNFTPILYRIKVSEVHDPFDAFRKAAENGIARLRSPHFQSLLVSTGSAAITGRQPNAVTEGDIERRTGGYIRWLVTQMLKHFRILAASSCSRAQHGSVCNGDQTEEEEGDG